MGTIANSARGCMACVSYAHSRNTGSASMGIVFAQDNWCRAPRICTRGTCMAEEQGRETRCQGGRHLDTAMRFTGQNTETCGVTCSHWWHACTCALGSWPRTKA
ncbi:LOW QUALITY PROTEIN: hypothetical protein TorRG33x02_200440 [Trema orientale]|uniref:Uncharacterized protein n=1 Tax=Trema orientale TaxID=63057 RepID=A0A2P5EF50_TREOI|nr:LOW QUALITY PROTEIN: hypothetical protein TorRG33x02_200440 [Trema orientale]